MSIKNGPSKVCISIFISIFLVASMAELRAADIFVERGYITMLRAQQMGSGFGPDDDKIDVEIVIHLDNKPRAFGLQLRNGRFLPSNEAMFELLRTAYIANSPVVIDYEIEPGKKNGILLRVMLER